MKGRNADLMLIVVFVLFAVSSISCGKGKITLQNPLTPVDDTGSIDKYVFESAETEVTVNGGTYTAHVSVWYDYMPGVAPTTERRPFISGGIVRTDSTESDIFTPEKAVFMREGRVWIWNIGKADYNEHLPGTYFTGSMGPLLDVHERYDLVIVFKDTSGKSYAVKIENVGVGIAY